MSRWRGLVIFDWDGTLVDSAGRIVACLRLAAADAGLDDREDAEFADIIGLGLPQAVEQLYPGLDGGRTARFRDRYAHHFIASDIAPSLFFPGAIDTLRALRERGYRTAVATGKSRRGLDRALAAYGVVDCFCSTRCADETASKPDPRMLLEILEELGMDAGSAVMVGDTEYDMAMAARAGIARVGVSFGVHAPERLGRHDPLAVIDRLPELLELEFRR